jgi:hypothetical protein
VLKPQRSPPFPSCSAPALSSTLSCNESDLLRKVRSLSRRSATVQMELSFVKEPPSDVAAVWTTIVEEERREVVAVLTRLIAGVVQRKHEEDDDER